MSEKSSKNRRKKKGRKLKTVLGVIKWILILAALLTAALFGLKAYIRNQAENAGETQTYTTAPVMRGAMEDTVYGSGTTSAASQPNVLAKADGTLTQMMVSVGDEVKAGDILAVIQNAEIDDTITDLEFALWELDDQITSTRAGTRATTISAPAAGRVMALYADVGDDVLAVFRREGALALISTDGRMKVELTGDAALPVGLNDRVTVAGETFEAEGTVTDLTRQGTCAVVTIIGDQYPMGEMVTVRNADGDVIGSGEMQVNKPMAVSFYGGTIKRVAVNVGDTVARMDTIFNLEDSPLTLTVESLRLQRETAANDLRDAKEQRENLIIVAPCDGVVATVDAAEGDAITAGTLVCSILQGEGMNLTIAVDELDVVDVKEGQKVSITVDAFSGAEYAGEVRKIAPVGTNSGGVTTYDVQLAFEAEGTGVRSGMNATGEITIASKEDTLYVPVEALMTIRNETYVMTTGGTQSFDSVFGGTQGGFGGQMPDMSQMQGGFGGQMPDMSQMQGGFGGQMPDMSQMQGGFGGQGRNRTRVAEQMQKEAGFVEKIQTIFSGVKAWLYEGVETSSADVSGTLVKVTVGMQNDDYAEILDGLHEGDVVMYTGGEEENSSGFGGFGGNRGGMGMGGFGGMPMGGF